MAQGFDPTSILAFNALANAVAGGNQQPPGYIYQNIPGAQEAQQQYGIPPVLTQASPYATAGYITNGPNGGVSPLVGYPSVYPHVLNGVPQDYTAPYIQAGQQRAVSYDPQAALASTQALNAAILAGFNRRGRGTGAGTAQAAVPATAAVTDQSTGGGATGGGLGIPNAPDIMIPPPPADSEPPVPPSPAADIQALEQLAPEPIDDPIWDLYTQYNIWQVPFMTPEQYAASKGYTYQAPPARQPNMGNAPAAAAPAPTPTMSDGLPLLGVPNTANDASLTGPATTLPSSQLAALDTSNLSPIQASALRNAAILAQAQEQANSPNAAISDRLRAAYLANQITPTNTLLQALGSSFGDLGSRALGSLRNVQAPTPATNPAAYLPPPTIIPTPAGPVFIP